MFVFFGFFPFTAVVASLVNHFGYERLGFVPLVAYWVWLIVVSVPCEYFHCPRCGELFFGPRFFRANGMRQRCYYCNLWKWDTDALDAPRKTWH